MAGQVCKYHFEFFNNDNGQNILRMKVDDGHWQECVFDQISGYYSWNNYGTSFKLTADGNLVVSKINQDFNPRFEINGAKVVSLGGQNFKELKIAAQEVKIIDDLSVANLEISSSKLHNNSIINTETTKINTDNIINSGQIQSAKTVEITAKDLDNNGGIHAAVNLNLSTDVLHNEHGNLSGINKTIVNIKKDFITDQQGEIGVSGKTKITFGDKITLDNLGIVRGEQVQIVNPATIKQQGIIAATKEVVLTSPQEAITMPGVDFNTPILKLQALDFHLKAQTKCDRTILETTADRDITLTNNYKTAGTFDICEDGVNDSNIQEIMKQRFGDIKTYITENLPYQKYNILIGVDPNTNQQALVLVPIVEFSKEQCENLPNSKYSISLEANIKANKGANFLTPNAKIIIGNNELKKHSELLLEKSNLVVCATQVDIKDGGVAGKNAFIWAPGGSVLERLAPDFSKPNVSASIPYSVILSFTMNKPIEVPNGSFFDIKEKTVIIGYFINQGNLKTQYLKIDSTTAPSLLDSGTISVSKDCLLNGQFFLRRYKELYQSSIMSSSSILCSGEAANLRVEGLLSGDAVINNEASIISVFQKSPEVKINSTDLKDSSINGGTPKIFFAQTSFNSTTVLSTKDTLLEGMLSAPKMLITLGGKVALGSQNPYYINPQNPIRDLMSKSFNIHTTYVPENLKKIIAEATKPKFYFMFRERFWFNKKYSQKFYQDIFDHVVVKNRNSGFTKPTSRSMFLLSPNYLINRVKEECQQVLMRGYIYENRPINEEFIKELHRNTTEYLRENNLSGEQFSQALVLFGTDKLAKTPTKPMLYYQAFINDQGLEVLSPFLYIPEAMINEVRTQRGGLVKTNLLCMLPEDLTPEQLIAITKDRPALHNSLIKFFKKNPTIKRYLHNNALTIKRQQEQRQLVVSNKVTEDLSADSSVTVGSTVQAEKLATVAKGGIIVNGQLETKNTLLASLFDYLEIKSIIGRSGNQENFDDVILSQARVHTVNILQMFAGKSVIFEGAETDSGVRTEIQALANILDLPVALVHQRVQHFYEKRKSGIIKDTYVEQHVSKHKSGADGSIHMVAGNSAVLQAPEVETAEAQIISIEGETEILDATEAYLHEEQVTSKKRRWHGGTSKKSINNIGYANRSKSAKFKVKRLVLASSKRVKVRNIHSTAVHNILYSLDGEVAILLGKNSFAASKVETSSDLMWQKTKTESIQQTTYSGSEFSGKIEIHSQKTTIEQVRGKTLNFLQQINPQQGEVIYSTLEEYYDRHVKKVAGPGPGLVALVSLAATIATQGTCSVWAGKLGLAAKGLAHTMVTAGFSSLCGLAAGAIVANNGDPIKASKELVNSKTVKSVATAMISAGIMQKLCAMLKLPNLQEQEFIDRLTHNLAKSSVNASLNMSINHQKSKRAINSGLIDAAFATIIGTIAAKLEQTQDATKITELKQTLMHFMLGGAKGVAKKEGFLLGGLEGLVEILVPRIVEEQKHVAQEEVEESKQPAEDRQNITKSWLEEAGLFSKVLRFSDKQKPSKTKDDQIMDKYGLIASQAMERQQVGFAEKVLDFFMPVAYGDELPQLTKMNNKESTIPTMPFEYEAFRKELFLRTGFDGSLGSESFLDQMKREYRNNYFKATLENDPLKQEQCRVRFSWILNQYRSLRNKFSLSDWRPLGIDAGVKTYTVGTEKDKNGKHHYRDLDTGKFSKSALDKAQDSWKKGTQLAPQIDTQVAEILHDNGRCYKADFGRSSIPGIETGGRIYGCKQSDAGYHIDQNVVSLDGSIGVSAGVNLASGTAKLSVGDTRLDVDTFSGELKIGGNVNFSKDQTRIGAQVEAKVAALKVKGEFKSKKACYDSNCYQLTVEPYVGVGLGIQGGVGYNRNSEKKDTFTLSSGLGLIPMLGAKITVEKEQKQQNIDNTSANLPKPSL